MKKILNILGAIALFMVVMGHVACREIGDAYSEQEAGNNTEEENTAGYVWPDERRYYYSSKSVKCYIKPVPNKIVLHYDKKYVEEIQQFLQQIDQCSYTTYSTYNNTPVGSFEPNIFLLVTEEDSVVNVLIAKLKKLIGVKSVNPLYVPDDGIFRLETWFTDEIIMRFKDGVSQQEINKMHEKFSARFVETILVYHIFSIPVELDPLDVANAYQESDLVEFCSPNFISKGEVDLDF